MWVGLWQVRIYGRIGRLYSGFWYWLLDIRTLTPQYRCADWHYALDEQSVWLPLAWRTHTQWIQPRTSYYCLKIEINLISTIRNFQIVRPLPYGVPDNACVMGCISRLSPRVSYARSCLFIVPNTFGYPCAPRTQSRRSRHQ